MNQRKKMVKHTRQERGQFVPVVAGYVILYATSYCFSIYAFLTENFILFMPFFFLLQFSILVLAQLFPIGFWKTLRIFTFSCGCEHVESYDAPLKKTS